MSERDFLSDDKIQDYIDNRLNERDRAAVAAYLLARPDKAEEVEILRMQTEALKGVGREILDEPVPERLRLIVQPEAETPIQNPGRRRISPFLEAVAAILLLLVGGGLGWFANDRLDQPDLADLITSNVAGYYAFYGAERDYPIDFPPDRTSELVSWFSSAFERDINPPDLSQLSYEYRGGRMVPAAGQNVGLFLFGGQDEEKLFVFFWRGENTPKQVPRMRDQDDIVVREWAGDGVSFAVMSGRNNPNVDAVADAVFKFYEP